MVSRKVVAIGWLGLILIVVIEKGIYPIYIVGQQYNKSANGWLDGCVDGFIYVTGEQLSTYKCILERNNPGHI